MKSFDGRPGPLAPWPRLTILTVILLCGTYVVRGQELRCSPTLFQWSHAQEPSVRERDDSLVTDRPDFTEASSTVGLGRTQLEIGYTFALNDDDGIRTESHSVGEQLWRIGVLADWFELRIGFAYFAEERGGAIPRDTVDGADDLLLGCKLGLTHQEGWAPEMALVPQCRVPTGADAFSAGEFLPGLNFLYGWDLTDVFSFAGSTQANKSIDDSRHDYTEFAQSLTLATSLTDRLGMYNEWFAFFPHSALSAEVTAQHYLNGGFTFLVNNDLQFDVRAGLGLSDRAEDFFSGVGISKRW